MAMENSNFPEEIWQWKITYGNGKSPFLIGKPSINGALPTAMLNNQRVSKYC